jgi:hypothetical protein
MRARPIRLKEGCEEPGFRCFRADVAVYEDRHQQLGGALEEGSVER